ncbi:MAG: outer membrane protein assembly factor BamD [Candidatus Nitrospinota bacterium M3_3B_026]
MPDTKNHHSASRAAASVVLAFCALSLSCASKELAQPDAIIVDRANNLYARERFTQATDAYRQSIQENPDSPYRKTAILALADSLYKEKKYFEALLYYERFVELYPLDPLKPRAVFYMGMSYYHDSHTPDRDQTQTEKAVESFDTFLRDYPEHPLAPYAKKFKREMGDVQAASLMEIGRFYHRINKNQSAILRLTEYLEKYPAAADVPEALYLLADSYYREQAYKKSALALADLLNRFPESEYAAKAKSLARAMGLKE